MHWKRLKITLAIYNHPYVVKKYDKSCQEVLFCHTQLTTKMMKSNVSVSYYVFRHFYGFPLKYLAGPFNSSCGAITASIIL